MEQISAKVLLEKIANGEQLNIIDIREHEEVQFGKLAMATHIPMNEIPDHMHEFKVDETYYIICAHGVRSERVTEYLLEHDFKAVNVTGGMAEIM